MWLDIFGASYVVVIRDLLFYVVPLTIPMDEVDVILHPKPCKS